MKGQILTSACKQPKTNAEQTNLDTLWLLAAGTAQALLLLL